MERFWGLQTGPLLSRKDRQAGSYQALIPALLVNELSSYGISEALQRNADLLVQDLIRFDEQIGRTSFYLNYLLIRSETISSSWIEGNQVSPKALAIVESLKSGKPVALKVLCSVQATVSAVLLSFASRRSRNVDFHGASAVIGATCTPSLRLPALPVAVMTIKASGCKCFAVSTRWEKLKRPAAALSTSR